MGSINYAAAQILRTGLTPCDFAGQTFESMAGFEVTKKKLPYAHLPSITRPNSFRTLSIGNLTGLRSLDMRITQDVAKNFCSMGLSDLSINGTTGNILLALLMPKFSLRLVVFRVGVLSQIGQRVALTKFLEIVQIRCLSPLSFLPWMFLQYH